jgi:hypothetical protein
MGRSRPWRASDSVTRRVIASTVEAPKNALSFAGLFASGRLSVKNRLSGRFNPHPEGEFEMNHHLFEAPLGLRQPALCSPRLRLLVCGRVPGHLWHGTLPGFGCFVCRFHSLRTLPRSREAARKRGLWDCKVTPPYCTCQERNTIGCISSNDGLDAGGVDSFSTIGNSSWVHKLNRPHTRQRTMAFAAGLGRLFS